MTRSRPQTKFPFFRNEKFIQNCLQNWKCVWYGMTIGSELSQNKKARKFVFQVLRESVTKFPYCDNNLSSLQERTLQDEDMDVQYRNPKQPRLFKQWTANPKHHKKCLNHKAIARLVSNLPKHKYPLGMFIYFLKNTDDGSNGTLTAICAQVTETGLLRCHNHKGCVRQFHSSEEVIPVEKMADMYGAKWRRKFAFGEQIVFCAKKFAQNTVVHVLADGAFDKWVSLDNLNVGWRLDWNKKVYVQCERKIIKDKIYYIDIKNSKFRMNKMNFVYISKYQKGYEHIQPRLSLVCYIPIF